jgi:hypothetical protein
MTEISQAPVSETVTIGEIFWDAHREGSQYTVPWAALSTDYRDRVEAGARAVADHVLAAAPDDEYRITEAGKARADAEEEARVRYALVELVEQMGHRSTVAAVREATFCGAPMLEVTDLKIGSVHLVSPQSLYEVTWLAEDEARRRAKPWTAVALPAAAGRDAWPADDENDESAREMAEEGNAVAMSAAERDEYERDGEAWLDAQAEAADADEEREIQRLEGAVDGDDFDEDE